MKTRIQNLESLRGLLALLVVISHIPRLSKSVGLPSFSNLPIFNRGTEAVFVFFTLSGFLIIGLLYKEKGEFGRISIKNFYARRILRLYPVYYFVLIFGFMFYKYILPFFNIPYDVNYSLAEGFLWNIAFLPNVFNQLYDPGAILDVLWSIGIEEQFYLGIAPLLALIRIKQYSKYLIIFTIAYFTIFHVKLFPILHEFKFLYFFMSAGGITAILVAKGFKLHFNNTYLKLGIYFLFILYFTTQIFEFEHLAIRHAFQIVLFNLTIVNLANDNKFIITAKLPNYIGKISYGIYMYHVIIINLVLFIFTKIPPLQSWMTILIINATSILGSIVLAHLSYKYYESYFLKLKGKFRKQDRQKPVLACCSEEDKETLSSMINKKAS